MLDEDHHCALADAAAARWGRERAIFVRSSASHVFRAGDLVLRMAPLGTPQAEAVARSATTARLLAAAGAPVPSSVESRKGLLVEEVDGMVVTALPVVAGTTYDDDELTADLARLWGRTLARFHETGYVHGDPEPDNLVVDDRTATFVDLDDAEPGEPVGDLAFALRAWTPPGGLPDPSGEVPAAFLAGYQETGHVDLARLPAAVREVERRTLASYLAHATTPVDPDWPEWALRLHAVVSERATELGAVL